MTSSTKPDPRFLEWGTDPSLYKYTSSLVLPTFQDQSYATVFKGYSVMCRSLKHNGKDGFLTSQESILVLVVKATVCGEMLKGEC